MAGDDQAREGPARRVGSDRLVRKGAGLVVYSDADMDEWEVRRYRRIAIDFEGRRYVVSRRDSLPGGAFAYVLEPWPAGLDDDPAAAIEYSPAYVARRDAGRRANRRGTRRRGALLFLLPLVGLLPSGMKARLHDAYGINPQTATLVSLWGEYVVLLACGLLMSVFMMARAYGGGSPAGAPSLRSLALLAVVVLVDAIFRTGSILEAVPDPPGFYEWLLRGYRR